MNKALYQQKEGSGLGTLLNAINKLWNDFMLSFGLSECSASIPINYQAVKSSYNFSYKNSAQK